MEYSASIVTGLSFVSSQLSKTYLFNWRNYRIVIEKKHLQVRSWELSRKTVELC